jgi:hypothetical protein
MDRRTYLGAGLGLASSARLVLRPLLAEADGLATSLTLGVVLLPVNPTLADWPERAKRAGLTAMGIYHQDSP